jgi:hypothetical protein
MACHSPQQEHVVVASAVAANHPRPHGMNAHCKRMSRNIDVTLPTCRTRKQLPPLLSTAADLQSCNTRASGMLCPASAVMRPSHLMHLRLPMMHCQRQEGCLGWN